ncbi:MAG: T9SS type A sorting domain-containing protein [Fluviicola sp.]
MRKISLFFALCLTSTSWAQCDSVQVANDMIVSTDVVMSGTYVIDGDFEIQSGVTVFVAPYASGGCGALKIYADNITISGIINGDFAGFEGGAGGSKGLSVSSITGHATSLTSCNDSGTEGHISVEGGLGGNNGEGPGAGEGGNDGNDGSGSKQYCGNFGDEAGLIGGAGGAGGGSGGSYGGEGGIGAAGGDGSNIGTAVDLDIESSYGATAGTGGAGGSASMAYGTLNGRDIQLGSGGAGAGGGGRSYYLGSDGFDGGSGGGMVFLKANNNVTINGTISVNGQDGSFGGNGGSGDATDDCCSDGCNGCDERTFSCGSGAGAGSGGGSGGGIFIECLGTADIQGTLTAKGGAAGGTGQVGSGATCTYGGGGFCSSNSMSTSDGDIGGEGGSGGGGRIKIYALDCSQPNLSPTINVSAGIGVNSGDDGTYAEVCGYANLNDLSNTISFSVYPNPFNDLVIIQLPESVSYNNPAEVVIIDAIGKVVATYSFIEPLNSIHLSQLNKGIYMIQTSINNQTGIRKISKQ